MDPLIAIPFVTFGMLTWAGVVGIWIVSLRSGVYVRIALYIAWLVLYMVGFFCVYMGLEIDKWDDSPAWYWDSLLFGSMTALAVWYGRSRFSGTLRALFTVVPLVWLASLVLSYLPSR